MTPEIRKTAITSVFLQLCPYKWYQRILREKIHLPELFEIFYKQTGSNFSPNRVFFDPRDIAPKCIFGYYSCYLQDRREFKPTRVVYFFTRNTMVVLMLLYLEKRGCYSRFYRIFSLKSDKKLPFDPYMTPY